MSLIGVSEMIEIRMITRDGRPAPWVSMHVRQMSQWMEADISAQIDSGAAGGEITSQWGVLWEWRKWPGN